MVLFLKNLLSKKTETFEVDITAVLAANDLHIALIDETTCHLLIKEDSDPYTQIHIRKIHHIVYGNFKFGFKVVYCKVALITTPRGNVSSNPFTPFILELTGSDGDSVQLEMEYDGHDLIFEDAYLINYKEYSEYCDLMNTEKLSFKEFIVETVKRNIDNNTFNSYQPSIINDLDTSKLISNKGFMVWLDEQEEIKAKVKNN